MPLHLVLGIPDPGPDVVAGVADSGLDLVAEVPDVVADVVSVDVTTDFTDLLLAFAIALLQVIHGARALPMPSFPGGRVTL